MLVELVVLVVCVVAWVLYRDRKPPNMPPGPAEFPFIGNISLQTVDQLIECREKYGNIYTTRYGNLRNVTLCDYNVAKEALASADFSDRPHYLKAAINIDDKEPGGIIFSNGAQWVHDRRFVLRIMRDLGMGKTLIEESIQFEAQALVDNLTALDEKPTKFPRSMRTAVLNVVWLMVASKRYDLESTEITEIFDALEGLNENSQKVFYEIVFPILTYLPMTIREYIADSKTLIKFKQELGKIAKKHVLEYQNKAPEDGTVDLMSGYIAAMKNNESNENMSMGGLVQNIADLFAAGSDTTTNMLKFATVCMVRYPEAKKKCQEEIDREVSKGSLVSLVHRQNLPYVEAYILELLRHSSLAYMGVQRAAVRDTTIQGYFIPKGTLVCPDTYFIHRDPQFWDCPEDFKPQRFIDKDGKFQPKLGRNFAFGSGRRQCAAEALAKVELYLFVSAILQNFDVELPPGNQLDPTIQENIVFRVRFPVNQEFIFKARK